MTISVAMAAYNGSRFIHEQICSVLPQLGAEDELVISLDPSSDDTEKIVRAFCESDARVKLLHGKGQGLLKNFEHAISACTGDIIFLCDQDDVWMPDKVKKVLHAFEESGCALVMHDARIVDIELNVAKESFFAARGAATGRLKNIIKNSYIGCCMAFKRELMPYVLPFPQDLPMHDQWIGLLAETHGGVTLLQEPLLLYRRHGENASDDTHADLQQMVKWRISILKNLKKANRRK